MFVFTVVQLLVIAFPPRYGKSDTKRRVQWSLAIIWVYSLLTSAIATGLKLIDLKGSLEIKGIKIDYSKTSTVFITLDLCIHFVFVPYLTVVMYMFVYRTFRQQAVKALTLRSENAKQVKQKRKEQQSQRKYLVVSLLLIVSMFLFAQPTAASSIIIAITPSSVLNKFQYYSV